MRVVNVGLVKWPQPLHLPLHHDRKNAAVCDCYSTINNVAYSLLCAFFPALDEIQVSQAFNRTVVLCHTQLEERESCAPVIRIVDQLSTHLLASTLICPVIYAQSEN